MRQPVLFISHGAPTVALEQDGYAVALRTCGAGLASRASAVVVMSAHWEAAPPVRVTSHASPPVIYDFGGFPEPLYEMTYPAPGDPLLAGRILEAFASAGVSGASEPLRGWDHGVWIPLRLMLPDAPVPVVQVSLPAGTGPEGLMSIGRALATLRDQGVLLVGSGGIVHNLRRVALHDKSAPVDGWARDFDSWFADRLSAGDIASLVDWRRRAPAPSMAHPTPEHFEPVFFSLGAAGPDAKVTPIWEGFHYGNLSMRSFALE